MSSASPAESADRGLRASIVIPVRGRADLLAKTLRAVAAQTLPRDAFEVIVVDDGTPPPDEGEPSIEEAAHAAAGLNLRVLRQDPAGPAAARNRGLDAAVPGSPVIAFLDADVLPRPNWLERGLEPLEGSHPPAAVEGRTVVEPASERTPFTHQTDNRDGGRYPTCNLFVDRSWIRDRDIRFDARYTMPFREDSDFAFQVLARGGEIRWHPAAGVVHPPIPRGWTNALKLAKRYEMDALLKRRFPGRFATLDRRWRTPHLRQQVYAFMLAAEVCVLLSLLLLPFDVGFIEDWLVIPLPVIAGNKLLLTMLLQLALAWIVTTLVLCGGRSTTAGARHLPAAAAVALLVPWPWLTARIRGWRRFRGVEPFHPRKAAAGEAEGAADERR